MPRLPAVSPRRSAASVLLIVPLVACGGAGPTVPTELPSLAASADRAPDASPHVVPAPGSDSALYPPNPGAIVVAIDPGHGGCLDWGVPDPSQRGEAFAEKTMTLGIGLALRELLEEDGVRVVMTRDDDTALAGDRYEPLGCDGSAWRDANGDGLTGFGPDVPEATRTRDELQARIDLANLAAADAFVSVHVNSPFDAGQSVEIAFSETFYTDETPWGPTATARLAELIQAGVVEALAAVSDHDRGDRGTTAHNFYLVAPPLFEPTPERPDPLRQPTRGALMPAVLAEVGSITLRQEHDLLVGEDGQRAVAEGLHRALREYFSDREMAARVDLAERQPDAMPSVVPGSGPPFGPPIVALNGGELALRVTNTGTRAWPAGERILIGLAGEDPYPRRPGRLTPVMELPALEPGAAWAGAVALPDAARGAQLAWITIGTAGETFSDLGSAPLLVRIGED